MKILHIIGSMHPASGGPCQGIRNSNPEMVRLGSYREVVTLDDPGASFLGSDDFPVHAVGPGKGPWQYSAKLIPWLTANVARFDVVVINGLWIYSSYAGWKVLRALRTQNLKHKQVKTKIPKLFIMPHGMLDPYFQRDSRRRLKAIRNFFYWMFIEKRVVNDADGILFTCQMELLLARETFLCYKPKSEINVGYGIISPPAFSTDQYQAFFKNCPGLNSHKYFLFISRIHQKKGVDLLIKSYAAVAKQGRKNLPKLVIAGPGLDTSFGEKMVNLAASFPEIKDFVFFPGMLTGDAKWGAFYGCEAFILPSYQENFGIAVVEAMACGTPVLISRPVNIWREIEFCGAGLVDADTVEGCSRLLERWLDLDEEAKVRMAAKAVSGFQQYFEITQTAVSLIDTIKSFEPQAAGEMSANRAIP